MTASNLVNGRVKSCGCLQAEARMTNRKNLGTGWVEHCKNCGSEFRSFSHQQQYCSDECSFLGRLKKIDETGCIEGQGNTNNQGYGVMRAASGGRRKMVGVHRYAWTRVNGEIPKGFCICHKCDNRKCVNIDHLFLGTWYDNNHDRSLKGRSGKRGYSDEEKARYSEMNKGEKNKFAKLTAEQVLQIKALRGTRTRNEIAAMFNVSLSCVKDIFGGKTWTFLKDDM